MTNREGETAAVPTWEEIDRWIAEQKFAAAREGAAKRLSAVDGDEDPEEWTRALVRIAQLDIGLHGYETAVRRLREASWPENDPTSRAILGLIYGHTLRIYLSAYRWEIDQRERVVRDDQIAAGDLGDLKSWTTSQIVGEIHRAYSVVWSAREEWGSDGLGEYAEYVEMGGFPTRVRGTLRDAVSYLWSDLLADSSLWTPEESALYRLKLGELLQGRGEVDAETHPLERLSGVLGDLKSWHRASGRPEAAFEAELETFRRLHGAYGGQSDRAEIRRSLRAALDRFDSELAWWAVGQVTLAEFVREEGSSQSLVRARELALAAVDAHPKSIGGQRAAHVVASIEAPSYRLQAMRVDGVAKRSILVQHRNLDQLWFRAYRLDLIEHVEGATDYNLLPRRPEIEKIMRRSPNLEWSVELPQTIDYREHRTFVTPPVGEPALYLFVASADPDFKDDVANRRSAITVVVSDLVLLGRPLPGEQQIAVRDGASGEPLESVRVARYRFDYRKGHRRIDEVWTGGDGLASFPARGRAQQHFFVAERGQHRGLLRMQEGGFGEPTPRETAVLYTDRSVYRPGQKVLWKSVAYRSDPGEDDYRVLPGKELLVELFDANGELVAKSSVETNRFGSASGEFSIPSGRLLGRWDLRTSIGGSSWLRVEEYKRPTFEVELEDPLEALRLNRSADLSGRADYLFGLPLAGGEVSWRVEREPVYPDYWWGWRPQSAGEIVASGETVVDGEGGFRFSFVPEADERLAEQGVSYRYRVHSEVTDEGGETRSAERSFRLGFVSLEANLSASQSFYESSEPIVIQIARTDLDGAARPGEGRWKLTRLRGPERAPLPADLPRIEREAEGAFYTEGDLQLARWEIPSRVGAELGGWNESELVGTRTIEHESSSFGLELGTLPPGGYRVSYSSEDPFGSPFESSVDFLVVRAGNPSPRLSFFAEPSESTVTVGGMARLVVASGLRDREVTVEVFRAGQRIDHQSLKTNDGVQVVEFPVTEEMRGGFSVRASLLSDYQLMRREHSFHVPWDDRQLSVSLTSFRDRVSPGDRETWRVQVLGPGGEPTELATEVLAYMYDRSLDLFAPHSPAALNHVFPNRVGVTPLAAGLGSQGELWVAETGFAQLPNYPHLSSGAIKFYPAYGIGGPGRRGGMRQRRMLAAPSAVMMEAVADSAPVQALSKAALADAESREGAQPGESDRDGEAPPAPALRENFAETAFWEPHLVTDERGEVALEFTVPDSLTEWRVWLTAMTENLSSGSNQREIVSAKDLMVRPYLPRFVREGDDWVARVLVRNAGGEPLSGTFDFDLVDPDSETSVADSFGIAVSQRSGLPFALAAGEETELRFPLKTPNRLGAVAVRAVATTDSLSDGELRPLPVLPGRLHLAQSKFVTLHDKDRRELHFADLAADDDPTRIDDRMIVTLDGQLFYSVLSALPYLVDYPYECTEQTLNRFLSTGIVSGLYDEYPAVRRMAAEFSERETPLESWEADDPNRAMALEETPWLATSRGGEQPGVEWINVLDPKRAGAERRAGLRRLEELQTSSGGFPWMPGGPPSPYMTLYLLSGFSRAIEFGMDVPQPMIERAWAYLHRHYVDELVEQSLEAGCCWERVTFLNFILSSYDEKWTGGVFSAADRDRMLDFSFAHWKSHAPRLKVYLALTLAREGRSEEASLVWASVVDSAITTVDEGTFWAPEDRGWLWYNDTIETHALALRAMMELDPTDERRHGLVQWLLLNKKLGQWKSTRATAEVIYSLVHYLKAEGQLAVREQVEVAWGPRRETFVFEPEEYSGARQRVELVGEEIDPATDATIVVEKETPGFLFASATWHFSTEELPEDARGDLLGVTRSYYRRLQKAGEWVLEPIDASAIRVGDSVEVHLSIRAKHAAEYVHLRDPRPAGFEPETLTSRYRWDLGLGWYEEIRDSGTNFFFERLPVGEYTLKYRLRANLEGSYRSGPATMQSMYAPEFVAYSSGAVLAVE